MGTELDERRELVRVYVKEDIDALKSVQNLTEKKRRVSAGDAPATASELMSLSIPAPSPEAEAAEEKRAAERGKELEARAAAAKASATEPAASKKKTKPKRTGFCLCGKSAVKDDTDCDEMPSEPAEPAEPPEPEEKDEADPDDPAEVKLYPPGRLIHLFRHCGARRAVWIKRTHPALHHIEVMHGAAQDHSGDSYKQALEEALFAAKGVTPVQWKSFGEVSSCPCCKSDFTWSSVLRSEPHRLQARWHCHSCGDVVCDGCSQQKRPLPQAGIMREVRVCDRCFLNAGPANGSRV